MSDQPTATTSADPATNSYAKVNITPPEGSMGAPGEPVVVTIDGHDRELLAHPVKVSMFTMVFVETDTLKRMRLVMKLLDAVFSEEDAEWLLDRLYDNDSSVEMVTYMSIFNQLQEQFAERPTGSQPD